MKADNNQLKKYKSIILDLFPEIVNMIDLILDYTNLLIKKNNDLNLISRKLSLENIIYDHIIDCISGYKFFKDFDTITDIGTGSGLPGIILAIIYSGKKIELIEKSPKKSDFLKYTVKQLKLKNVTIINKLLQSYTITSEAVTCRAFKDIKTILTMTNNENKYIKYKYILYKGRKEKILEELQTAKNNFKIKEEVFKLDIFKDKERHIVLI